MTIQPLRNAYFAEPFVPFVIRLADGRGISVQHREFMATAPNGRTILVFQPDSSWNVIDLLLVTDLEFKAASGSKGTGNGKQGRKR